jgi:hypothetical protein
MYFIFYKDPPGRCYWINSPANGGFKSTFKPEDGKSFIQIHEVDDIEIAFSEVTFSTTMFTDHSPHHYESSLEVLWAEMQ